jgi:redox-sensitive bicupin YhaK (pirin superfamily)
MITVADFRPTLTVVLKPLQNEGRIWGFQLWVNLPKKLKWIEPSYHDMHSQMIPEYIEPNKKIRVIAGEYMDKKSIHTSAIPFQYYDVHLQNTESFKTPVSANHTTLIYVYQGELQLKSKSQELTSKIIQESHLALFSDEGDEVDVTATSAHTRFIFLSAEKINEPIARGGPFVMNDMSEIHQAFSDYQMGLIG